MTKSHGADLARSWGAVNTFARRAVRAGADARLLVWDSLPVASFVAFFSPMLDSWVRRSVKGADLRDGKVSFNVAETRTAMLDAYSTKMMSRALDSVPGARQALSLKSDFSGVSGSRPDLGVRLSFSSNTTNATSETVVPLTRHGKLVSEDRLFASMQEAIQQAMAKTGRGWGPGTGTKTGP